MKKSLYFILLAVEFFVSFIILAMAAGWLGWTFFFVVAAVWAVLMIWQLIKLKRAAEIKAKRKAKVLMALIMLLPLIASIAGIMWIGHVYF